MPPRIHVAIPDFGKYAPAAHDRNGELLKLGLEGCACLTKSMDAEGEERRRLLERCLELRLRERDGWLKICCLQNRPVVKKGKLMFSLVSDLFRL